MILAPNSGEVRMLKAIVNHTAPEDLTLKLFTNDMYPAHRDAADRYTEASGFGYAPIALMGTRWTFVAGAPSIARYPEQTFTFTGELGNVYGYFIVQGTSGIVMWAERFTDGPYSVITSGSKIKVPPTLQLNPE